MLNATMLVSQHRGGANIIIAFAGCIMDRAKYLERISVSEGELSPDIESLRRLQRAHLLTVPFENLDIHWKRPIVLDVERFYHKVVVERRGGFCYELNGLFNELLISIGFTTRLISARVFNGKEFTPKFSHAAIIVTIGEEEFLADVGFGDFTSEPLSFAPEAEEIDPTADFVIRRYDEGLFEVAKRDSGDWKSEYLFKDEPHELSDFAEMCDFQQYSPLSHFTKAKLISIMTPTGRKTLTDTKFIVTDGSDRRETDVTGDDEFYSILLAEFGIKRPTEHQNT